MTATLSAQNHSESHHDCFPPWRGQSLNTLPTGFLALVCDHVAIMKPAQTLKPMGLWAVSKKDRWHGVGTHVRLEYSFKHPPALCRGKAQGQRSILTPLPLTQQDCCLPPITLAFPFLVRLLDNP